VKLPLARRYLGPLLLIALQGVATPSLAQPRPGPAPSASGARQPPKSSESGQRSKELIAKGATAFAAGDVEGARTLFADALEADPTSYEAAGNLGFAELQLQAYRAAAEHLALALKLGAASMGPEKSKQLQGFLDEALAQVSAVTVVVNVPGAEVLVNGKSVGKAPLEQPIYVNPGKVDCEAQAEGYTAARVSQGVAAGSKPTIALLLTKPSAQTEPVKPLKPDQAPAHPNKTIIIAGAAVALAGVAVGAAMAAVANSSASDRDATLPPTTCVAQGRTFAACQSAYQDAADKRLLFTQVSFGSFLGAGVIGAAVAAYALWPRSAAQPPRPAQKVNASFFAGPHGGGAALRGSW
jgi:hypothetical protein